MRQQTRELLADLAPDILVQQVAKATAVEFCERPPELAREIDISFDQAYATVQPRHTHS